MATRKNLKRAARKTSRRHNGGGGTKIAAAPESPEMKHHVTHKQSGKVEEHINPSGTRKRLIAFHEKRVKELKKIDEKIVKAAENLLTYENIYPEKSPDTNFTTSAERAKLRGKSALKQIKVLTNLYNKRGQIVFKKSEGKYHGKLNASGQWSPESSPESSKLSSNTSSKSSNSETSVSFKPFQTVKLDALKKPVEKTSAHDSVDETSIQNAIQISKTNMKIIQEELDELKKKYNPLVL